MAVHKIKPGESITCTAGGTITDGQLVTVSDDRTVIAGTAANGAKAIGSAATDAGSGDDVLVLCGGVQRLIAASDIAAGDLVVAADDGKIASVAAVTTPTPGDVNATRAVIGIALTSVDVSEVVDDRVEVRLFR
jgi:hypothetical protein